jgi:cytochrome c-type biogenesis protein CcmH/NrfG
MRGNLARFIRKTTRICRLTATGLLLREMNADTLAFQQRDSVHASAREELIDRASGEEINVRWALPGFTLYLHFVSVGKLVKPMFGEVKM